jgi:hypothetical protein
MASPATSIPAAVPVPLWLFQKIEALWESRIVVLAAQLKLPDHINEGADTVALLAERTGIPEPSMRRAIRAMITVGLLRADASQRLSLEPPGDLLRSDVPGSMRANILVLAGEQTYESWADMVHCLRTGETGFERRFGKPIFRYYAANPEASLLFDQAMSAGAALQTPGIVANYDFSAYRTIIDIGGGQGSFLCAILKASPHSTGILFDRPEAAEGAGRFLANSGVAGRTRFIAGDLLRAVPEGSGLFTIKWVLHDFNDEQCLAILRNIRRAMNGRHARLLVIEGVTPDDLSPSITAYYDLQMMMLTGGRERSTREFGELFQCADFELTRVITAPDLVTTALVEARPV